MLVLYLYDVIPSHRKKYLTDDGFKQVSSNSSLRGLEMIFQNSDHLLLFLRWEDKSQGMLRERTENQSTKGKNEKA